MTSVLPPTMRVLCVIALLLSSSAPDALAADYITQRWNRKLTDSSAALKAGDYRRALRTSDGLLGELQDSLGRGPAETELLAIVVAHKALAHAGLLDFPQAQWYFDVAIALDPRLRDSDISMFGEPARFLREHMTDAAAPTDPIRTNDVIPPRVLKHVAPKFPEGANYFGVEGELKVRVIIDTNGVPVAPRIVQPLPAPTLSYAALDALRRWRFTPAMRDGKPVDTVFNLTIHYKGSQ